MEIIWGEGDAGLSAIYGFVDTVLKTYNADVTDTDGTTTKVMVLNATHGSWRGHELADDGLLCLVGWRLDDDYEVVDEKNPWWLTWDSIAKIEVH